MRFSVKRIIVPVLASAVLIGSASCSALTDKFNTDQTYSAIKDEAYRSVSDIDPKDNGVFMKTVAGVINSLDKGDKKDLKRLLRDCLLEMETTDDELDQLVEGFEGDIIDTTPIRADLRARGYGQWSGSEPVACYDGSCYIYTDEETYYLNVSMCSVNDKDKDGDDSVGVCLLELMTIDLKYGLERSEDQEEDLPDEYVSVYSFPDGTSKEVEFCKVGMNYCGIVSAFGDSDDYVVIDTATGYSYNIYRLTGTSDEIDLDDVKDIDDKYELYEFFDEYEEYAEADSFNHFYNIEDSDDKLLVWIHGENDDSGPYVTGVQVMDISKPYGDQKRTEIYKKK